MIPKRAQLPPVRVSKDEYAMLENEARALGVSLSALIRVSIDSTVEDIRSKGRFDLPEKYRMAVTGAIIQDFNIHRPAA